MTSGPAFRRLLNPGPVALSDRVREAQLGPDLCHREVEFRDLFTEVRSGLLGVYPQAAGYQAIVLTGSGTAAVEAMVSSLVPRTGRALVVANGIYGERIASMLMASGRAHKVVRSRWTEPLPLAAVERALDRDPGLTHALAVHHETTTGRLNDIGALAERCRARGVVLLLDVVSSFGGEAIGFADWEMAACAGTANKCLHGVPGLSFVLVRSEILTAGATGATSLYLDLYRHAEAQAGGYPLFTPAVQATYALREALAELAEAGGWTARRAHYRELSGALRGGLQAQGVELLLDDEAASGATLTAFVLPGSLAFEEVAAGLKEKGFIIYPGQQSLREQIFRVAIMGALERADVDEFLEAFADVAGALAASRRDE
ncbi:MAG: aminotransferase class V-fold PLP-dependent enzyme [Gemmatimonadota bacterium]